MIDEYGIPLGLFGFLNAHRNKKKMGSIEQNNERLLNIDKLAYDAIKVLTGADELEKLESKYVSEGEKVNMSGALKEMLDDRMEKGMRIIKLYNKGFDSIDIAKKLEIKAEEVNKTISEFINE